MLYDRPVIRNPGYYWLLTQQGDEVPDYQLAITKYAGAKQTIEANGSQSFEHFERYIPSTVRFFKQPGYY